MLQRPASERRPEESLGSAGWPGQCQGKARLTVLNLPEDGKWKRREPGSRTVAGRQSRRSLNGCQGDPSRWLQRAVETKAATPAAPARPGRTLLVPHWRAHLKFPGAFGEYMCWLGVVSGQSGQNAN
ncbi:hypothetical protein CCHR01_12418 [Colletotrichum chrysophilum]|uniref:Uncharacterized protein n=1 Tax=Colletotrichum chrysophilum TaxID=1836956 RepID=A0AAD9AE69_9PEZI|nr:hypothetical protein CCHR01_12418 [Colletotrichum chrysophilum]